jgi:SAM-dependent methyltransferase
LTQERENLRDPRLSFDNAADIYNAIRPHYPAAMFQDFYRFLPDAPTIVEVGPGTGQATADLLKHGATVTAVEIGPRLGAKLQQVVKSARLHVVVGDFETVHIPEHSYDAVFSATAYHWISASAQLDRPAQLLRPRGVLAVVDLNQVTSADDKGFFAAAQPIYERYGEGHKGPLPATRGEVVPPIAESLRRDRRFTDVEVHSYDWNQTYTADQYGQLMLSYSGTQMMDPERRQGLLHDMVAFIDDHFDGRVTRPLVVTLTIARTANTTAVPSE